MGLLTQPSISRAHLVLHRIFEAQAEATPDAIAVVFGADAITYRELDRRANRIAWYLRRQGIASADTAGMALSRGIDAYAAMLGILKAGAAYVPIDPAYPSERAAWMLRDCGAKIVLNTDEIERSQRESDEDFTGDENDEPERDLCYVIYTSGSTGRPKGVMVEHRNAAHLVRAEGRIFGVRASDRVYQGASLCFDLSVEEMWLAFHAGATLVAATPEMAQAGPDLSRHLARQGVTVLSCVPTLLSMMEGDVPSLRLLILGGERCPPLLTSRWARAGRRIVNTYGPTETTVIATYADIEPGKPITIGHPVPGYEVYILDKDLQPLGPEETGEICIGGAGVARGYVGLREETRACFVTIAESTRIYRSGDLGRMNRRGEIEFMGRADQQVKLRGRRVELGEIESAILRADGIRAAACAVRKNGHGAERLVGYVVAEKGCSVDEESLLLHLRAWLPEWMTPSAIENVAELPRLPSGKLDRAGLPEPRARERRRKHRSASSETEVRLVEVWTSLLYPREVSVDDDFFLDLGGHSLLAARMVTELRRDARFASVTMRDVYNHPTIAELAALIDRATHAPEAAPTPSRQRDEQTERRRHFLCGLLQSASLYFVFGFRGMQWITPYLVWFLLAAHHRPVFEAAAWAFASGLAMLPLTILTAICAKWILLGRVRPGRHPLWGGYYLRWWFVQNLVRSVPLERLGGTPWLPFVYRLFGARVGKNVHIASDELAAFDVIAIGDGSSVDEGVSLAGYTVNGGDLLIGPISIGRGCFIGTGSVLEPGSAMEDDARLEDLSLLQSSARIPGGQTWAGSPPRRVFRAPMDSEPLPPRGRAQRMAVIALYGVVACCLPLVELVAFLPGIVILSYSWLLAPLAGAGFILCLTLITVGSKWLLIGRARAGTYPVHGWFYVRNWVVEQLLAMVLDAGGPLHATLFLKPWYRALGVRLRRFAEVSTASVTTPDLLEIGEDCTIADEVSLGAARVERGWLTLAPTKLGRRVFTGNNAVIPAGASLADESLIGVLTVAPMDVEKKSCWLGSPPIFLPRRETSAGFGEERTFRPSRKLQWQRGWFETLRVTLPGAGFVLVAVGVLHAALKIWDAQGPVATLFALPILFALFCVAAMLAVPIVKWAVIGRYQPFGKPFWSAFVWRLEFVNALFEFMATPLGLEALRGTPFMAWYLRLLGSRIGRGAYIDSTGFLEFDLTEIGNRAVLNHDCILQTHLFEDRVLKGSKLRVGANCQIGSRSIVLYDSIMQDGARLGSLSLLMKGETLTPGKTWTGSPLST